MKTMKLLFLLLLLALPVATQAQFTFTTNNGAITIIGYTGSGGNVTIPSATNGYPVTTIGKQAFYNRSTLTSVTIPNSVTTIGIEAFSDCFSLTNIAVDATNPSYASAGGVLFDKALTTLIEYPGGLIGNYTIPNSVTTIGQQAFVVCSGLTNVTIPNSVTNIGDGAFYGCSGLASITIPNSVTSIGGDAFASCSRLTSAYFQGNAPLVNGGAGSAVFKGETGTAYYLSGATGWGSTFGGWPTKLWNPQALTGDGFFGVQNNQFGFNITGSSNLVIVVEACTNLTNPVWSPISTNTLNTYIGTNGTSYFSDPQWTNYPGRFYRFRSP